MLSSRFASGPRSTSLKQDGGDEVGSDGSAGWSDESDMEEGGDRGEDAENKDEDSERVVVVCSELSKDDRLDGVAEVVFMMRLISIVALEYGPVG